MMRHLLSDSARENFLTNKRSPPAGTSISSATFASGQGRIGALARHYSGVAKSSILLSILLK
jgi:hypothetical protein